jgi:multidrug efflux system outer membrane protein
MRHAFAMAAAGFVLSGCASAPALPAAPTSPETWLAVPAIAEAAPDAYWNRATEDAVLQRLLADAGAIADVAAAVAREQEAQALAQAARASLFPAVAASGLVQSSGADRGLGVSTTSSGLAVAAPIDLFAGNRARASAAAARSEAATAALAQTRLTARRTAGQLYAALRAGQASRIAAMRQAQDAQESLSLARTRAEAGLENGLAVAQAQAAADAARARIPVFAQAETQARLGLEALLGEPPGALTAALAPAPFSGLEADRLLEAPAAVLARRPDVRAAQARLAAAGFDARAARADRWPAASLAATLTRTSATRGLDGASATGGITIAATLFDFGRLQAFAEAAGANARAEAALYERIVATAVAEVEQEVSRLGRAREEAAAARDAVASASLQSQLARARYTSGLSSFLDVLVADRAFADAEIALAAAEGRILDAGVSVAAALGLGQEP